MPQMTPSQARIVDPLVTELALGYRNAAFIGTRLFPRVPVTARAGRIPLFNRDTWRRRNTKHAPGANIPQVQVEWSSTNFSIVDRKLHGKVPVELLEEAAAVPGIDLKAQSLILVQDTIGLDVEMAAADLARNAANYDSNHKETLATTTRWTQSTSTPIVDVQEWKAAIRRSIGVVPNVLAMGESSFYALQNHASIVDRIKFTGSPGQQVNERILAQLFEVDEVVVGRALSLDDADVTTDVWGKDVVLAYVPKNGTFMQPSYGYSYGLRGYPYAGQTHFQAETDSWLVPWTDTVEPYLTGVLAGFLGINAGDAS